MTEHELFVLIEETKCIVLSAVKRYLPAEMYYSIDDAVQETYLRVHKSIDRMKFTDVRKRNNWIYTIAKHESLRLRRKSIREDARIDRFIDSCEEKSSLMEFMEEDVAVLREIVSLLPEKYRTVFELLVAGFSEKEVSEKLSIKQGTVKSRIHRGKEIIHRKALIDRGAGYDKRSW